MSKTVIITGAAGGIGREIVSVLNGEGFNVVATDIDIAKLEKEHSSVKHQKNILLFELDVTKEADFKRIINNAVLTYGSVDVLINNAAIMPTGNYAEIDVETEKKIFSINYFGAAIGIKSILEYFKTKNNGHIINVCSITAKVPLPYATTYSASKSALLNLTESLIFEYSDTDISFSSIIPSTVRTALVADLKPILFPPVISPRKVARAILKTIYSPRRRKFIPWYIGLFSLLQDVLPKSCLIRFGKALRVLEAAKP